MRKIISLFLAVSMVSFVLIGCDSKQDLPSSGTITSSTSATPVTIKFFHRWAKDQTVGMAIQKATDDYIAEHPNVKVSTEVVPGTDDTQFYEKLRTAAATGDMFELFQNYGGSTIRSYVDSGVLLDLSEEFKKDPAWKESFLPLFSMWEYKDKEGTYGLPYTYFATLLYCNKELFKQNELEYPKTIEEFEAVCDAFIAKGITPMPMSGEGWRATHLATGLAMKKYGGDLIYQLADRSKKYTDPEIMEIVSLIKSWQDKGYFGKNIASLDSTTEAAMFSNGQSPMICTGTWEPLDLVMSKSELLENDGVEVMWIPYFEDAPQLKGGTMGGPNEGISISKKDDATTAATVEYLKYLTSKDVVSYIWEQEPTQLFAVKDAAIPDSMNGLTRSCINIINELSTDLMQEITSYDPIPSMQDRLRNSLAGMLAGNTPEAAMKEVQEEIDNYIK